MDNRLYSCVLLFFACNAAEGYLIASGAFEIHFNGTLYFQYIYDEHQGINIKQIISYLSFIFIFSDVPIWSKIETGRIPQPPELFQIIDTHMQMLFPEMQASKMNK